MAKKFLATFVLALSLIFISNSQVEAREVFMGYYSDGTPVYYLTDSLGGDPDTFYCRVRAGRDYLDYDFCFKNGKPYYTNSEGYRGYVFGGQSPIAAAIWNYIRQGR